MLEITRDNYQQHIDLIKKVNTTDPNVEINRPTMMYVSHKYQCRIAWEVIMILTQNQIV